VVLCDTNGGSLPHDVQRITAAIVDFLGPDQQVGIHTQNDTGCAVANSLAAVLGGATQLQGTVNGYGERTGNANLMTCIPNLELKLGVRCLPEGRLERLTAVSRHVAELVNLPPHAADPYVGQSAFAHKGGLHTSALGKAGGATYEHIEPEQVGNGTRVLVSDLGGRAGMAMKAKELGVDLDDRAAGRLSDHLKVLESQGFVFEAADASLELLMREATGWQQEYFRVEGYRVTTYHRAPVDASTSGPAIDTEATVKVWVGDERLIAVGEGNGPVNALDQALRRLLVQPYPHLAQIHLTDYRVRILDTGADTDAVVRVLVDSTDGDRAWTTIGVSTNIIEASWQALTDALVWGLLHTEQ
jgi:2-isopropylmalate synthase